VAKINTETRLHGLPLVIATLAVALASFMNILDTTIAIVALPTISGNLGATASQGSWVITSYSVCLAVVLPLSGWITRRFGEVHTFCAAVLLFSAMSWLCAIATSFNQLLLFRALQGFSGGLLLPLSQSLLLRMYPPEKHGLALGIWGVTSAVAPVVGPMLGGFITDNYGWPWIFLINLPVGAFSAYVCWKLLRRFESETFREPTDFVGLFLLLVPWSQLWEANYFVRVYPAIHSFCLNPFTRGAVSGIGFLHLLVGTYDSLGFIRTERG